MNRLCGGSAVNEKVKKCLVIVINSKTLRPTIIYEKAQQLYRYIEKAYNQFCLLFFANLVIV
jgi:hypothetical protein